MEYIRNASSSQISILEAIRREEQKPFIPYFFERRLLGSLVKKPDKNKKKVQVGIYWQ
jgi:hypothetical protein